MTPLPVRDGKPPETIDEKCCPFCGALPFLQEYVSYERKEPSYSFLVMCTGCHAKTGFLESDKQDAIDAWNERAAPCGNNVDNRP